MVFKDLVIIRTPCYIPVIVSFVLTHSSDGQTFIEVIVKVVFRMPVYSVTKNFSKVFEGRGSKCIMASAITFMAGAISVFDP